MAVETSSYHPLANAPLWPTQEGTNSIDENKDKIVAIQQDVWQKISNEAWNSSQQKTFSYLDAQSEAIDLSDDAIYEFHKQIKKLNLQNLSGVSNLLIQFAKNLEDTFRQDTTLTFLENILLGKVSKKNI